MTRAIHRSTSLDASDARGSDGFVDDVVVVDAMRGSRARRERARIASGASSESSSSSSSAAAVREERVRRVGDRNAPAGGTGAGRTKRRCECTGFGERVVVVVA